MISRLTLAGRDYHEMDEMAGRKELDHLTGRFIGLVNGPENYIG